MITSNTTQPKTDDTPKKLRMVNTNKLAPKEYSFTPRDYPGVQKRQVQRTGKVFLTTDTLEENRRMAKRAAIAAQKKAAIAAGNAAAAEAQSVEVRRPGRPRKDK